MEFWYGGWMGGRARVRSLPQVRGTDGAVEIKKKNEGEGYERPKEKDIVLVKLSVATADGTVRSHL